MLNMEEIIPDHDQQEEPWEERTLNLLENSEIDQFFSEAKARKKGGKKHKLKWMRRPMAIPDVILEFLDEELRENALRALSNFLIERREQDPENYYRAGFLVYNSCATLSLLLQEVVKFFIKMVDNTLNVRSIKRLANVLTLFQSVAANKETRHKFVDSAIPNFLIPMILFESTIDIYDNLRAIALSVIGILCQGRETNVIHWALEADLVEVCRTIIETGSELSKVIAMHILESILQTRFGISYICEAAHEDLLKGLMKTWDRLVILLAVDQDFSPRLLFHIIRCYIILCTHDRGFNIVLESLPSHLTDRSFNEITKEFPIIKNLLHQLLLSVGKVRDDLVPRKQPRVYPVEERIDCLCSTVSTGQMLLESNERTPISQFTVFADP